MNLPLNGSKLLAHAASALTHNPVASNPSYAGESIKVSAASLLAQAMAQDNEGDKTAEDTWPYSVTEAAEEQPKRQRATDPSQGMSSEYTRTTDPLTASINKLVTGRY